jgi:NADH-quinone oxidoreductase subunit B
VVGGVDLVLPVDMYVPGCPCRPEAIIDGLAKIVGKIDGRTA